MKLKFFIVIVMVISLNLSTVGYAYHTDVKDSIQLAVALNLVNIGVSRISSEFESNLLPIESSFIQSALLQKSTFISSSIELYPLKKIGIRAGFTLIDATVNEKLVRMDLQNYIDNYTVKIQDTDYENSIFPFAQNYRTTFFEFGVLGNFDLKKFAIVPHVSFLFNQKVRYPIVFVGMQDNNTGEVFERSYNYDVNAFGGVRIGNCLKYTIIDHGGIGRFFIDFKIDYLYHLEEGAGYYFDKFQNGSSYVSEQFSFSKKSNFFLIGFGVGAQLNWHTK